MYVFTGICLYAALMHGLIAAHRSTDRVHLLFCLTCLALAWYVCAKAGAYTAMSVQDLVAWRRLETAGGMATVALLPWFASAYTGVKCRWLVIALGTPLAATFLANLVLPFGAGYAEQPTLRTVSLPWGETVADLRYLERTVWYHIAWSGIFLNIGYVLHAAWQQFRGGARHRALMLGLGAVLFLLGLLFNVVVNLGMINFVHTAEFGLIGLVLVMNLTMVAETRKQEGWLHSILNGVREVVSLKDRDGRYLFVNRQYESLFEMRAATVVGRSDRDLFSTAEANAIEENDRQVLDSGKATEVQDVFDRGGETRHYSSMRFPLRDSDGVLYAICSVSTDITETRQHEQQLREMTRQVWHADRVVRAGALSASLAHELNQPLTSILSNAQAGLRFLAKEEPDILEIRQILGDIVRDDKRAATVVSSLRTMVRKQSTAREQVDLAQAIADTFMLLHSELLTSGIEPELLLEPGWTVQADKAQLQQVVLNLVVNAIAAMESTDALRRRLRVSLVGVEPGLARVAFRDSGPGIPAEQVPGLFQAFNSSKTHGLGLGLTICRSIVEAHGGRIWMSNNDDGPGATFCFDIPASGTYEAKVAYMYSSTPAEAPRES